jgi:hypothetical protein
MPPPADHTSIKRFRRGGLASYEVMRDEFESIESEAANLGSYLQAAIFCFPIAITITITLLTVPLADGFKKDAFFLTMLSAYVFGCFFAYGAWRQRGRFRRFMQKISANQVEPLGEKGQEVGPAELQNQESGEPEKQQ